MPAKRPHTDLHNVPVKTLCDFMEAVSTPGNGKVSQLADHVGMSESTARRALAVLETLEIVERGPSGDYVNLRPELRRGSPRQEIERVLRNALHRYQPFELLCEGLSYGESESVALRKAAVQVGLKATQQKALRPLVLWGVDLGVLEKGDDGKLHLAENMRSPNPDEILVLSDEDVESEARARLYIGRRLGRDLSTRLDGVNKDLLVESLLKFGTDPKAAADKAGQALENFLRELATELGYGEAAKKRSGAGQLASLLREKDVILAKHVNWANGAAALRNATGHSKDKDTVEVWELDPQSGFWGLSLTLSLIRSIHEHVRHKRQVI